MLVERVGSCGGEAGCHGVESVVDVMWYGGCKGIVGEWVWWEGKGTVRGDGWGTVRGDG